MISLSSQKKNIFEINILIWYITISNFIIINKYDGQKFLLLKYIYYMLIFDIYNF